MNFQKSISITSFIISLILIAAPLSLEASAQTKTKPAKQQTKPVAVTTNTNTATPTPAPSPSPAPVAAAKAKTLKDYLGINFFSFIDGPGFTTRTHKYPPNAQGLPTDNGINSFNILSFRYKFHEKWALDLQTRSIIFFNNGVNAPNFSTFRWESPRIGISGPLATGENWRLTGAVNTDFPYFLPSPFAGYSQKQRTLMFNPGTFANFRYNQKGSKWSLTSIVAPRFFYYKNRLDIEPEANRSGQGALNKPEFIFAILPTLNYDITEKTQISLGTTIDYRKQIGSKWSPFRASLHNTGFSDRWRMLPIPVQVGVTQKLTDSISIFPYIRAFPIAKQRLNLNNGYKATFKESMMVGIWFSGNIM